MSYSISAYYQMIADPVRRESHKRAAIQAIRPGSVVVELGTGSGYFAVLACQLGARKVYAIEPDKIIEMASRVARENGCSDRIEFFEGMSTDITLPEKADVVFCDLRGASPFFGRGIPSIIDARERFLAPGGTLVPERDELYAAFVSSPRIYSQFFTTPLHDAGDPDLSAMQAPLRNLVMRSNVEAKECVSGPLHMGTIVYQTVDSPTFRSSVNWSAPEPTTIHGLSMWFDATLIGDVTFSSGPYSQDMIYSRLFFPFAEPVSLDVGDLISLAFEAFLVGSEYIWRWNTVVSSSDGSVIKTDLRQSSFESADVSSVGRVMRTNGDYVPPPSESHEWVRFVLDRVDGSTSLDLIARQLAEKFPHRFADSHSALVFAGDVVERSG